MKSHDQRQLGEGDFFFFFLAQLMVSEGSSPCWWAHHGIEEPGRKLATAFCQHTGNRYRELEVGPGCKP